MGPILVLIVTVVAIYFLSQGVTGVSADAPGHCDQMTQEDSSNKLGYDEIYQLAQNAGFDTDSDTATAIALAESGGDPNAYNPETQAGAQEGAGSYGLWQIYKTMHPEFDGQDLTDPVINANAAYQIYSKRGSFKDWSTYKNGAYQKFLA